jgi:DHA2 family multidrug resistance protein
MTADHPEGAQDKSGEAGGGGVPEHQQWHAPHNPWLIALVTTLATFMEILDTTIVNVALPHIAGNLGADVNDSTWVLTSYLVSNAIVLPLTAWFASLMGRRNFYMACVALFTASSFLCGFAPTLGALVLFRLLQGVGGGGLQPMSQAILVDTFPARQRGMAMAVFGMTVVTAPIIGPTLGGWITDNFSWRWIFYINIPVGLLSLAIVPRFVSDPPYYVRRKGPGRFRGDFIGLALICLGLGALQIVLDLGERKGWLGSQFIVNFAFIAAVSLIGAVFWEIFHKDPILDIRQLRERNLGISSLIMFFFASVLYGSTVVITLFMQVLLGYSSLQSGLALSPGGVASLVMLPIVGVLTSRMDARKLITFGMILVFYGTVKMGLFSLDVDFWAVMMARIIQAFGLAFVFVPLSDLAFSYVPREARNNASSLNSVARNIGGSVGIAVATAFTSRWSQVHQTFLVGHLTPYDADYTSMLQSTTQLIAGQVGDPATAAMQAQAAAYGIVRQQAATLAFVDVFRLLAFITICTVPMIWLMRRSPHTGSTEMVIH